MEIVPVQHTYLRLFGHESSTAKNLDRLYPNKTTTSAYYYTGWMVFGCLHKDFPLNKVV